MRQDGGKRGEEGKVRQERLVRQVACLVNSWWWWKACLPPSSIPSLPPTGPSDFFPLPYPFLILLYLLLEFFLPSLIPIYAFPVYLLSSSTFLVYLLSLFIPFILSFTLSVYPATLLTALLSFFHICPPSAPSFPFRVFTHSTPTSGLYLSLVPFQPTV